MKKYFLSFLTFIFFLSLILYAAYKALNIYAVEIPDVAISHIPVCAVNTPETPRCHAHVKVDKKGKPLSTTSPTGYGPSQFLASYNLSGSVSNARTIAIIDAYDHPNIFNDVNTYSSTYGIPLLHSCPVSTGTPTTPCFQKVNQRGGTSYPVTNSGWALEIALDVEAAHAICQNCNILLVEADSNSYVNLMAAVDQAVAMGAKVISNSYGSSEFSTETSYDSHFNIPGIAFTFSSGDSGYGTEYPAASRYVTAVGGTTLSLSGSTYLGETAWNGSGSGCSQYENKPSWQTDSGCAHRTIADVAADADPNTGASVYDSISYNGQTGWFQVGGTSLASPIIAATYALAGDITSTQQANSVPYSRVNYNNTLHDVISGSNGHCKKNSYLCLARNGYDGPTGLGSPKGYAAF